MRFVTGGRTSASFPEFNNAKEYLEALDASPASRIQGRWCGSARRTGSECSSTRELMTSQPRLEKVCYAPTSGLIHHSISIGRIWSTSVPRPNNEIYSCRVCGLLQRDPPWGLDGHTPSFDICPCCGVEFGYEDCGKDSVVRYRRSWLASGPIGWEPKVKPESWDLDEQLAQIPEGYRD